MDRRAPPSAQSSPRAFPPGVPRRAGDMARMGDVRRAREGDSGSVPVRPALLAAPAVLLGGCASAFADAPVDISERFGVASIPLNGPTSLRRTIRPSDPVR